MNNILFSSTSPQAGAGVPVELIDFTWNGPDNTPAFLVVDYAGALPALIRRCEPLVRSAIGRLE